jgi:TorA maturation chaperone TorD
MMGDARDSVLEFYNSVDFRIQSIEANEPEDHISHELWLLSFLYKEAARAQALSDSRLEKRALDAVSRFKAEHLDNWVSEFCDGITKHASTPFYQGVAQLLRSASARPFVLAKTRRED